MILLKLFLIFASHSYHFISIISFIISCLGGTPLGPIFSTFTSRWLIVTWITAIFILSSSYSGMLKAAMTIPLYSKPISTLTDVLESELQVEIVDYVEYEGSFSQSEDSNVKKIFDNRVNKEFSPFINVDKINTAISVHINYF